MDITGIIIDRDRGQVTLKVSDAVSGLEWGVFPEPEEQGPQRADETEAAYESRLAALVETLRARAIAVPHPLAGKPPAEKRDPEDLLKDAPAPVLLTDKAAISGLTGFKAADMAALDAHREAKLAEIAAPEDEVKP